MNNNILICRSDYSVLNALNWGNCRRHWNRALSPEIPRIQRVVHGLIALIQSLPIIGQLASLAEYAIVMIVSGPNKSASRNRPNFSEIDRLLFERNVHQEKFPHLQMCDCSNTTQQTRQSLEDLTIQRIQQVFGHDLKMQLTVVSMGSGKCLQDLIYLARLKKAGFSNIKLILIDPGFAPLPDLHSFLDCRLSVQDLKHYVNTYLSDMTIAIESFSTTDLYEDKINQDATYKPHLLCLIDFDGDIDPNKLENLLDQYKKRYKNSDLLHPETLIAYTAKGGQYRVVQKHELP